MEAKGQMVPVSVTLSVDSEGLSAELDFADGMFSARRNGDQGGRLGSTALRPGPTAPGP